MADDTSGTLSGAFDGGADKGKGDAGGTVTSHSSTVDLSGAGKAAGGGEAAWQKGYNGHADLKDFARQKGDDPTAWEYDTEKLGKTLKDRLSHIGKLEATIASLRGSGDDNLTVPAKVEDYMEGFDHEALKAKAARAYLGRPEKGQNPMEATFFSAMYDQGVPVEKAREAFTAFMLGMNEQIAVPKTSQEQLQDAVKALGPNGRQQLAEVNEWLQSEDARDPFDAETKAWASRQMRSPEGLSFLWRQSRRGTTGAPPSTKTADVLTEDEIREAMVSERYSRDPAYRERILSASRARRGQDGTDALGGWSGRINL